MGDPNVRICLSGGRVIDPANPKLESGRNIWISGSRIVDEPPPLEQASFRRVDCSGRVLMPGGIDLHSHIVGPKVNAARLMQPELFSSRQRLADNGEAQGGDRIVPTVGDVGWRYLGMGYTTVMDAAITPLAARIVHRELEQLEAIDSGFFLLAGNNHGVLSAAETGDVAAAAELLSWLLKRCGGYAPKIVNPGGVEQWKQNRKGDLRDLDQAVSGWDTTPRKILAAVTEAANRLGLPHPVHIHCNNLGMPGNWQTTLETLRSIEGLKAHLAHIQFHSYGGKDAGSICSQSGPLVEWINQHPEVSVDVGQIVFGDTTSMTADSPLGQWLAELDGRRWFSADVEVESGCGVSPIRYDDRELLNSVQWAIGLEWLLNVRNPWQVALSTDHPNGGSFLAYPQIIRLLMDSSYRRAQFEALPRRLRTRSPLGGLTREYSLEEIAIITRAGPARMLGLADKGHLGRGAIADIAVYSPSADQEQMFALPWLVIKSGNIVLHEGQKTTTGPGKTHVALLPEPDAGEEKFDRWFAEKYSLSSRHLGRNANPESFDRELAAPVSVGGPTR